MNTRVGLLVGLRGVHRVPIIFSIPLPLLYQLKQFSFHTEGEGVGNGMKGWKGMCEKKIV